MHNQSILDLLDQATKVLLSFLTTVITKHIVINWIHCVWCIYNSWNNFSDDFHLAHISLLQKKLHITLPWLFCNILNSCSIFCWTMYAMSNQLWLEHVKTYLDTEILVKEVQYMMEFNWKLYIPRRQFGFNITLFMFDLDRSWDQRHQLPVVVSHWLASLWREL